MQLEERRRAALCCIFSGNGVVKRSPQKSVVQTAKKKRRGETQWSRHEKIQDPYSTASRGPIAEHPEGFDRATKFWGHKLEPKRKTKRGGSEPNSTRLCELRGSAIKNVLRRHDKGTSKWSRAGQVQLQRRRWLLLPINLAHVMYCTRVTTPVTLLLESLTISIRAGSGCVHLHEAQA
jgi:hypothetical protein